LIRNRFLSDFFVRMKTVTIRNEVMFMFVKKSVFTGQQREMFL
jgi:hypothetical protein